MALLLWPGGSDEIQGHPSSRLKFVEASLTSAWRRSQINNTQNESLSSGDKNKLTTSRSPVDALYSIEPETKSGSLGPFPGGTAAG